MTDDRRRFPSFPNTLRPLTPEEEAMAIIVGLHSPTDRIGSGWNPFRTVYAEVGVPAEILWRLTADGVCQMTVTSIIVAIEPLETARIDPRNNAPGSSSQRKFINGQAEE